MTEIWITPTEQHAEKLKRVGFNTLVVSQEADNLTDAQADATRDNDAVILADAAGPEGYAERLQPLLFGIAKTIRVEHFDSCEAKREVEAGKRAVDMQNELMNVAGMDGSTYEAFRKTIAKKLGVRVSWLDEQRQLAMQEECVGSDEIVIDDEPWPDSVDGDALMHEIVDRFERHIVLPDGAAVAMSSWVVLTYCYDLFRVLPILGIVSPQKRCGKTTTLDVLIGLSYRALPASNISPAALFRSVEKFKPMLAIDEADSFLKNNEELRGILNSGQTKPTAYVIRCDGDSNEPRKFSTWGPKVIAAIGKLPGTVADRSIIINLRRKTTNERREKTGSEFDKRASIIRRMILKWVTDNADALKKNRSTISIPGNDRATDNWSPLAAIADTIGGQWLDHLTAAAKTMLDVKDDADDDLSVLLLTDIRDAFQALGHDRIFSANLVNILNGLDERPWSDLKHGHGLTTNVLARFLDPFEVRSKTLRIGTERKKGYERHAFDDAFKRYIPTDTPFQTVTTGQDNNIKWLDEKKAVTTDAASRIKNADKSLKKLECHDVTDKTGVSLEQTQCHEDEVVL